MLALLRRVHNIMEAIDWGRGDLSSLWDYLMINGFSISAASIVPRVWQALLVQNFHVVCSTLYNCFLSPRR